MSLQRILRTISTVPPPPLPQNHQEEEQGPLPPALNYEQAKNKKLLGIDLNKSFLQDDDCNSPPAKIGGGATASSVLESKKLSSVTACDLNSNENQEVPVRKNEMQIQYCSEVETSIIDEKSLKKQNPGWAALLEVTEICSRKLEEDSEKDGREIQTRKQNKRRRSSEELELSGELQIESRQQRNMNQTENTAAAAAVTVDYNDKNDRVKVVEAENVVPPVIRSNRGRTQALPYKYRDSIIDPWTELSRQNNSSKSSPRARARATYSTVRTKPRSR
ncbi:Hypothetical predicted protein [Olea europaea subsp. europaea]|uniref:Uncharacterized protein n=1 Tax=Olea europaea subsp. europaea TaxID=158383 RepID=A0A8S0QF63_OLEEU|nr:Hypothetical predicted protein [Olea europaea subsp. europaea]